MKESLIDSAESRKDRDHAPIGRDERIWIVGTMAFRKFANSSSGASIEKRSIANSPEIFLNREADSVA